MRKVQTFLLPLLLLNPYQKRTENILNDYDVAEFYLQAIDDNTYSDCFANRDIVGKVITINAVDNREEFKRGGVELIDLKDKLFPKPGTKYSESTQARGGGSSKKTSILIYRSEQTTRRGVASITRGSSSATHPENISNFEKANIPIDPLRNPNRKPDKIQNWKWDRAGQRWKIIGERKVKVGNKIITERQWSHMSIGHSRQI